MVTALVGIKEQNSEFGSRSVQYVTFWVAFFFFKRRREKEEWGRGRG